MKKCIKIIKRLTNKVGASQASLKNGVKNLFVIGEIGLVGLIGVLENTPEQRATGCTRTQSPFYNSEAKI